MECDYFPLDLIFEPEYMYRECNVQLKTIVTWDDKSLKQWTYASAGVQESI